ncbi:CpsD/CapB family tyrosine-protein kinase [Rhizorhapis sp. SPR117]|uniref:CpsD/CapB family tyrosine-protein kinase n=1 Tax=Rhizorhapis sp. SPR117 TaxID=2912611 RepID=UPI001F2DF08F|nr:CpsD/CapB family tyrosine-protein kinase [Rhizorhapis sp. SPR117]
MDDQAIMDGGSDAPGLLENPPEPGVQPQFHLSKGIILAADGDGPRAEALRSLRTQLMERHLKRGRRAIAVCGPGEGVGTSFMAANLAFAFARAGVRTLLIDTNLRCPAIHQFIVPGQPVSGLDQCLSLQGASFADAVQNDVITNLSVIYSGGPATDALEKLSGPRFQPLMDMCIRDFDVCIVDTPPANRYADALRITAVAGYGLIVLRKHVSFVQDVDTLTAQIGATGARVIGAVLNAY